MFTRSTPRGIALVAAAVAGIGLIAPNAVANGASGGQVSPVIVKAGCNHQQAGHYNCFALENVTMSNQNKPGETPSGFGPQDLQSAYNLTKAVKSRGKGQTIAIVDAYDDPSAEADLKVYRKTYGLPACTTANGCFQKLNQDGRTKPLPKPDQGWAEEITLDLDMVSSACPLCHIVLVESKTNSFKNLGTAEITAGTLADVITNSYGAVEVPALRRGKYTQPFHQKGVFIIASTGDDGYGEDDYAPQFPSVYQKVTAAGGTSLVQTSKGRGWSESAWGSTTYQWGAGSGCSTIFPKPRWQKDKGCDMRMDADVSSDADPETGVAIYDTYIDHGWEVFGGTSAASPFLAGVVGLAQNGSAINHGYLYKNAKGNLYDPVGGNNDVLDGNCAAGHTPKYFCNGVKGYDGPTGLGSPDGYKAF